MNITFFLMNVKNTLTLFIAIPTTPQQRTLASLAKKVIISSPITRFAILKRLSYIASNMSMWQLELIRITTSALNAKRAIILMAPVAKSAQSLTVKHTPMKVIVVLFVKTVTFYLVQQLLSHALFHTTFSPQTVKNLVLQQIQTKHSWLALIVLNVKRDISLTILKIILTQSAS